MYSFANFLCLSRHVVCIQVVGKAGSLSTHKLMFFPQEEKEEDAEPAIATPLLDSEMCHAYSSFYRLPSPCFSLMPFHPSLSQINFRSNKPQPSTLKNEACDDERQNKPLDFDYSKMVRVVVFISTSFVRFFVHSLASGYAWSQEENSVHHCTAREIREAQWAGISCRL
jgi:hypothetical protein